MEDIRTKEQFLDVVEYLKTCGKFVGRFAFSGHLHNGHFHILEKARNKCDILIADLVNYAHIARNHFGKEDLTYGDLIYEQLKDCGVKVDYYICNNFLENFVDRKKYLADNYLDKFVSYAKLVNVSNHLAYHALGLELTTEIDFVSTSFVGPKNAVPIFLAEKLFGRKLSWKWEIVWSFFRGKGGILTSRTTGSLVLSTIVLKAVDYIKGGVRDFSSFQKLLDLYYLENPLFSILDLDTIERLDLVTNNCVLVFSDYGSADFIFIKNGELIF